MAIRSTVLNKAKNAYRVTCRLRYSSGKTHGAIDIATPIGTPLYAPFSGTILGCHDGVHNNRPSEAIYSGKPSNWILLLCKIRTNYGGYQDATIYFQHLSPGLKVKAGQKVKKGQLLGRTGNSGNSSGPHIHIGGQWVPRDGEPSVSQRYDHINDAKRRIWPPERFLG